MSSADRKTAVVASDLETRTVRKLFWRLLPFLFLVYVVNYLDRINVGFAALQMQSQLGLSDRIYGLGAGIFFAGYFIFQLPSNLVLTRVGARRWIAWIMTLWGVISCCMIFVRTAHEFYELRFLLGAAEAGFFPGIILYLKKWFPANARARAVALFMTANPIAGVVGGPISGALLGLHAGPLAGWQWLFLIEGTPAVLLGIATLGLLAETPHTVTWLSPEQRSWLAATLGRERDAHPDATRSWSAAFLNVRVWLLTVVYFGETTCMYGLVYFLPKIIRSVSAASNLDIGLLSTIPYVSAAGFMVLLGMHSDRTGERRWHLAGLAFTGTAGAWAAGFVTSTAATVALLSLALSATFSMTGPFWALSAALLSDTTAAAGIALINSFGNLGGFLGPYSIGLLHNANGFRGGMIVVGTALALAGAIALLVRARPQTFPSSDVHPLQLGASQLRASESERDG
jgi:ACS family tartrate transporter-like MFS transporter